MSKRKSTIEISESVASIEVFGSVFALLIVLFVIMNVFSSARLEERLEALSNEGEYKISWGEHGNGYVVIAYPDSLFIIENGQFIPNADICSAGGDFKHYVNQIYTQGRDQIIFAVLHNGIYTMRTARDCIQQTYRNKKVSIGWMIIDDQTMKSIKIDDIPFYLKEEK